MYSGCTTTDYRDTGQAILYQSDTMKKVAIIGAGISGLCALRQLLQQPDCFIPVVLESGKKLGGLWVYTNHTGTEIQSGIYRNLKTNIPKEVMGVPDFPFSSHLPSFLHHSDIRAYIDEFAEHYDLEKHIKFQTKVTLIHPVDKDTDIHWEVTTHNLKTGITTTDHYDAVLICSGRHSTTKIPQIPGSDVFEGKMLHSIEYRDPEMFRGKKVVIIGMSFSGIDIAFDLVSFTAKLYAAHHNPQPRILPDKAIEMPDVQEIMPSGVIFTNGEYQPVDVIIYCTGYHYSFPFLSERCQVNINNARITPLYKHIHHIEYPTLFFINITSSGFRFCFADFQVRHVCKFLCGDVTLPSKEAMLLDEEQDFEQRIIKGKQPQNWAHTLLGQDFSDYVDDLAARSNIKPPDIVLRKIFDHTFHMITTIPITSLKGINYHRKGDDDFTISKASHQ